MSLLIFAFSLTLSLLSLSLWGTASWGNEVNNDSDRLIEPALESPADPEKEGDRSWIEEEGYLQKRQRFDFNPQSPVPTVILKGTENLENVEGQNLKRGLKTPVLVPDWHQISLSDLPPVQQSGEIEGKNRQWRAGQTPDQFLVLGDLGALNAQLLSIEAIDNLVDEDIASRSLGSFPLASQQSIGWLRVNVPGLAATPGSEIPLLKASIEKKFSPKKAKRLSEMALAAALETEPSLERQSLDSIDLSTYTLNAIPNLIGVSLNKFAGWGDALVRDIPGLGQVPLGKFPVPVETQGAAFMEVVEVGSEPEGVLEDTISGSSTYGFEVRCSPVESHCAYVKLVKFDESNPETEGEDRQKEKTPPTETAKYWISGNSQRLEGGYGCLGGGKEPTGRHPAGAFFKEVVTRIDSALESFDTALYLRLSNSCGATPYRVGPIPWMSYGRGAALFIGRAPHLEGQDLAQLVPDLGSTSTTEGKCSAPSSGRSEDPLMATAGGLEIQTLREAIAQTFEEVWGLDYDTVGAVGCREKCGRRIGKYGFRSAESDVRSQIASASGGKALLKALSSPGTVESPRLLKSFPPTAQDRLCRDRVGRLAQRLKEQIDPATGDHWRSERLVRRISEVYWGGYSSRPDSPLQRLGEQIPLKELGDRVVANYNKIALDLGGC